MKTTIKVTGMACMHCANKVEKALYALEGIKTVTITLENGLVEVEYEEGKTNLDTLLEAVNDTGFDAVSME